MKSTKQILTAGRIDSAGSTSAPKARESRAKKVIATCLSLTLACVPVTGVSAEEGHMMMQYEFELSKKPKFRQLNLAYQDTFTNTTAFYLGEALKPGVVVPLYSMNPRTPGLLNRLDDAKSEKSGEPKLGIGALLGTLLGVGLIAAYAYAGVHCVKDISNYDYYGEANSDSGACDALGSLGY